MQDSTSRACEHRDGEVSVEQEDFALPGRIPLRWVRSYRSAHTRTGVCGYGWETPADGRLEIDPSDGSVVMQYPAVGPLWFEQLPQAAAAAEVELMDGARLTGYGNEFRVRTKADLIYHFSKELSIVREDGIRELPLTRVSDLFGNYLEFEREEGRFTGIAESAGRQIVATFRDGRVAAMSMSVGRAKLPHVFVQYQYSGEGDLVAAVDALGVSYRFAYDQHHLVSHTDRNGLSFYYVYATVPDGEWRVVRSWGDGGLYDYRFDYLDALLERRITDSLGHVSVVKLGDQGLPLNEIDALGGVTVYEYDEVGRTTAVIDPVGHRIEYQYDVSGNLLKQIRPDGTSLSAEYDADNHVIQLTEPGGRVMQFANDRGRILAKCAPRGGRWT